MNDLDIIARPRSRAAAGGCCDPDEECDCCEPGSGCCGFAVV